MFEVVGDPNEAGPFLFTCEHASNALPPWLSATQADRALLDDHWGLDIGARELTLALRRELGGQAVLAKFTRLAIDANRRLDEDSLIVTQIDGQAISFNVDLDEAERERRLRELHAAYHDAIDETLRARMSLGQPVTLVAIHSFTPMYLGRARPMEVGILFDDFHEQVHLLQGAMLEQGFDTVLNAPYTGMPPDGLIYSCWRHGRRYGVEYFELEIRQDLIDTAAKVSAIAPRIAAALRALR